MDQDNQILKMADDVRRIRESYFGQSDYLFAKKLYEDGYRKQSEGEWRLNPSFYDYEVDTYVCSGCGASVRSDEVEEAKFCHNCGAKMKGR
jgi:DNA-directed RNA polymerase subunit RPC12/RpoP